MRERLSPIFLVTSRELRDQFRDWRIIFPMAFLMFTFPVIMNFVAKEAVDYVSRYGGNLILERLVPFSLLIIGFFPITVSLVVALEAFVGEKERGTIEPLLSTPLLDWQLYLGKLLVGILTPLLASCGSIALYILLLTQQGIILPRPLLLVQIAALTMAHTVLMVSGAIAVSTQSTTVRAANLLASFIVVPTAFLIQGESALIFWGNEHVLWLAVLAVSIMAGLLVRVGLAHFQREYLLGRDIDVLNLRWMWRTFWRAFTGGAQSFVGWYRAELFATLRKMWVPLTLIVALAVIGAGIGFEWTTANLPALIAQKSPEEVQQIADEIQKSADFAGTDFQISFVNIFGNNIRAVAVMFLVGLFSFGVLGMLGLITNMGLVGAVLALLQMMGYSPWMFFWAGLLPHGIFELPAIFLSSAVILHTGAVLVTPDASRSIGEVLLESLADWIKILLGLVLPLLLIAAAIETYVTPTLLLQALR